MLSLDSFPGPTWTKAIYIHLNHSEISLKIANVLVHLIEGKCTIPFIARYRQNMTEGMTAPELTKAFELYETAVGILQKMASYRKDLYTRGMLDESLNSRLVQCTSVAQLEFAYAPFKPSPPKSAVEKARDAGLETPAKAILERKNVQLEGFVDRFNPNFCDIRKVKIGLSHIICEIIFRNEDLHEYLNDWIDGESYLKIGRKLYEKDSPHILNNPNEIRIKTSSTRAADQNGRCSRHERHGVFNVTKSIRFLPNHQVSAVNREVDHSNLTKQIWFPPNFKYDLRYHMENILLGCMNNHAYPHENIIKAAVLRCIKGYILPSLNERVWAILEEQATAESIDLFAWNLIDLLLTPGLKGEAILGIDPGLAHGCKAALINSRGEIVAQNCLKFPDVSQKKWEKMNDDEFINELRACADLEWLFDSLRTHRCTKIVIGNGKFSRNAEKVFRRLIETDFFHSDQVGYCIVSECGSSVYSISENARKELGDMPYAIKSAVSIARRIQDPLSELIKIPPRSLGVGQYQHDLEPERLEQCVRRVTEECVSYVGVNINTCSQLSLERVSGMNPELAQNVIRYRKDFGDFRNRRQLLNVPGIDEGVFEQAAGFVRIFPTLPTHGYAVSRRDLATYDPLDSTVVHPESYPLAEAILHFIGCSKDQIGKQIILDKWRNLNMGGSSYAAQLLMTQFQVTETALDDIVSFLSQNQNVDYRENFNKPFFRDCVTSLRDVKVGAILPGIVRNVANVGIFIDLGVGTNGMIQAHIIDDLKCYHLHQEVLVQVTWMDFGKFITLKPADMC